MTTEIEKLRAIIEEKTRKFLEDGGKIDERKTSEAGLGKRDHSDIRATTMTLQEVVAVSGLAKNTIKSLTHQKKMPQAFMFADVVRHLRWNRAEIEAWLIERAANATKPEGALWIEEVAEIIGVSRNTVRNRANSGKFRKPDGYAGARPFWYAKNIK